MRGANNFIIMLRDTTDLAAKKRKRMRQRRPLKVSRNNAIIWDGRRVDHGSFLTDKTVHTTTNRLC